MNASQPALHTMVKDATRQAPHEVRHLLIHPVNGPKLTTLSQLVSGVQTEIAKGTQGEMDGQADALMREWAREGFRPKADREPVYEELGSTIKLAALMGYRVVYDPERRDVGRGNLTGAVTLAQWRGRSGKNGGGYQYAFTGSTIFAVPTLPPGHGINMTPASNEETVQVLQQSAKLLKTVGPSYEFVLGR